MGEKVMTKEEVIEEYGLCAVCADRRRWRKALEGENHEGK